MSESSTTTLVRPPVRKAEPDRAPVGIFPRLRLPSATTVAGREMTLRYRPFKPLRRPLSAAEVLEQQRRLVQLRAQKPALFTVQGTRSTSESSGAGREVHGSTATTTQPVTQVAHAPAAVQPAARSSWRRAVVPLSILLLAAGGSAFLLGRSPEPKIVANDGNARTVAESEQQIGKQRNAASGESVPQEVMRWKSAADRSSAKAAELSRELVSARKENASLARSVGLLEAETLNLQTELLERELDVVSLNAELEDRTDRRIVYNITNLPIDGASGAAVPESTGLPAETPDRYSDVPVTDAYSTAGQAGNAGNYGN